MPTKLWLNRSASLRASARTCWARGVKLFNGRASLSRLDPPMKRENNRPNTPRLFMEGCVSHSATMCQREFHRSILGWARIPPLSSLSCIRGQSGAVAPALQDASRSSYAAVPPTGFGAAPLCGAAQQFVPSAQQRRFQTLESSTKWDVPSGDSVLFFSCAVGTNMRESDNK